MKKMIAAFLIAAVLTAMAGCQRDDDPKQSSPYGAQSGEVPFPPDSTPAIHPMLHSGGWLYA